jgi:hypothetical protein
MGNVPDQNGRPTPIRSDRDQLNIINRMQVTSPSNHIFGAGHFQDTAAHLRVAVPDRFNDRLDW